MQFAPETKLTHAYVTLPRITIVLDIADPLENPEEVVQLARGVEPLLPWRNSIPR